MISHLHGTVSRMDVGGIAVDVNGVGYRAHVPLDFWESIEDGMVADVWVSTYVREDRLELYGFPDRAGRTLFEEFLKLAGIGPKLALELCAVPRSLLQQAVEEENPGLLQNIKGIGRKTAEKLIVELKSLAGKKPDIFLSREARKERGEFDEDAIAALTALGYDSGTAVHALKELPRALKTTEDRVAAALRSL